MKHIKNAFKKKKHIQILVWKLVLQRLTLC